MGNLNGDLNLSGPTIVSGLLSSKELLLFLAGVTMLSGKEKKIS